MTKVLFIKPDGEDLVANMNNVPSRGDIVSIFGYQMTVKNLCWAPGKITEEISSDIDVAVTLKF